MASAWYSPLFHLGAGGGMLLALPYDELGDWNVAGDDPSNIGCGRDFPRSPWCR